MKVILISVFLDADSLYHVTIPTDVSLLSLGGTMRSRAAGLQC